MKKQLLLIIFILNLSGVYSQWQKGNGPSGGKVKCLAKSDKYIVAGCYWNESGVFVSDDFGNSWNKVLNIDKPSYQGTDVGVNSIVQGDTPDIFYIGSSNEGIYKLFMNNETWELKTIGFRNENKSIYSVAFFNGDIFIGLFGDGIYKSSDEGDSWLSVNNGLASLSVVDIKINGDSIYAATTEGLYLSTNSGEDWNLFSSELEGKYVTDVFFYDTIINLGVFNEGTYSFSNTGKMLSKPNPETDETTILPIAIINGKVYGAHTNEGLFSSKIDSISWEIENSNLERQWPRTLINCNDTLLLGVSGFGVYKSIDKGISWQNSSSGIDAFQFTSIAVMDSLIFAATNISGAFVSSNMGLSWERFSNYSDLADIIVNDTAIHLSNGYVSYDRGKNWQESFNIYTTCLALDGKRVYAGTYNRGIYYTDDNGMNWQHISFPDSAKVITDIDAKDFTIFVGTQSGGSYFSSDNGENWMSTNDESFNQWVSGVLIKDTLLFISDWSTVHKSSDYGLSWEQIHNGLCCIPEKLIEHDDVIYGTFPTNAIYSLNNGENWSTISGLSGLGAISGNADYLFAGTYAGFYYHKKNSISSRIDTSICKGDSILIGKNYQSAAGIYYDSLRTSIGCDSTVIYYLTIRDKSISNLVEKVCGAYTSPSGKNWTNTGIYIDTITNAVGCDSIITIDLTIDCSSSVVPNESFDTKIYPNPFKETVFIDLDEINSETLVEVFTLSGLLVNSNRFNNIKHFEINIEGKEKEYILKIHNENGDTSVFKLIRQ